MTRVIDTHVVSKTSITNYGGQHDDRTAGAGLVKPNDPAGPLGTTMRKNRKPI